RICLSVVSHGQGALVDRLLDDLSRLPAGTISRLVVTVNLPNDTWADPSGTAFHSVVVLRNSVPMGFSANHNQAFLHCEEPVFAVVNPDIRLDGNPFPALLDRLSDHADFAVVAPLQVDAAGRLESFARTVPTPFNVAWRRLCQANGTPQTVRGRIEWLAGAFMLWRAEAFRRLGGFDDRYRLYCEDVDICLRLQLQGQRFAVVETARVIHAAQRTSRASSRFLLMHVRSLLRLWLSPVFWRFVLTRPRALGA
ncbi:MAG TPA: glycosyltransferase, partial [Caldimonas sp.]|nr:glycosyltransferase [Caldimonas sp.]